MFDKFKQGADMVKMANKLRQVQNQLAKEQIHYEEDGIKVVITGDMKIKKLEVDGEDQKDTVEVVNKAMKKAQEIVGKKMQEMGGLGDLFGR